MLPKAVADRLLRTIVFGFACWAFAGCGHEPVSVVLGYEVSNDIAPEALPQTIESAVEVINMRLGPTGKARDAGNKRIEVDIFGSVDVEKLKQIDRLISRPGALEFAALANRRRHQKIIDQALKSPDESVKVGSQVVAGWRPVGRNKDDTPKDVQARPDVEASRVVERDGKPVTELLVVFDTPERRVTGQYLNRAVPERDHNGRPSVGFSFNQRGAFLFAALTGEYQPETDDFHHRLAVLLDDQIHSAPNLITVISDNGQITGDFTKEEVEELASVLNGGTLPCSIRKVDERRISTP